MPKSSRLEGLAIRGQDILFKLFLPKGQAVPDGVRHASQIPEAERDRRNAKNAKAEGRGREAMVGRVRPGRVDTGTPVYQNEPNIQIASLRSLLAREGYRLSDVHHFVNDRDQSVIVMRLSTEEEAMKLPRKTMDALRAIVRENIWTGNIWDNGDERPSTANFTSPRRGEASRMIVVRDDFVRLVDLDGNNVRDLESAEDLRIARNLLAELTEK